MVTGKAVIASAICIVSLDLTGALKTDATWTEERISVRQFCSEAVVLR
jgi:hypothetical protein